VVLGAARQATTVRGTSECHFFVASLVLLPGLVASTIGGMSLLGRALALLRGRLFVVV